MGRFSSAPLLGELLLGAFLGLAFGTLVFFPGVEGFSNRLEAGVERPFQEAGALTGNLSRPAPAIPPMGSAGEEGPETPMGAEGASAAHAGEQESGEYMYWKTVRARVTAYTPGPESCGIFSDGFTSTGRDAWAFMGVASHPEIVPYGCYAEIPGAGFLLVDDTGSAMRESWTRDQYVHFDLRMRTLQNAKERGVRYLNVNI
ncbi:MAG: hypothetical protein HQL31_09860, partial [Planctomycetes bacterium]|nr:hypothetical protein [Planctomycetota bacterium]